jgi:putative intracellular protease/amidase
MHASMRAHEQAKENWGVHALLDARPPFPLVTGQNPSSSALTAELIVEALGGHKAGAAPPELHA